MHYKEVKHLLVLLHLGGLAAYCSEAAKVETSLDLNICNVNVLHLQMQDHVGLVGRERNGAN